MFVIPGSVTGHKLKTTCTCFCNTEAQEYCKESKISKMVKGVSWCQSCLFCVCINTYFNGAGLASWCSLCHLAEILIIFHPCLGALIYWHSFPVFRPMKKKAINVSPLTFDHIYLRCLKSFTIKMEEESWNINLITARLCWLSLNTPNGQISWDQPHWTAIQLALANLHKNVYCFDEKLHIFCFLPSYKCFFL